MRMHAEPVAAAVLVSALALGACASAPPSRPGGFSPPLTAGVAREYANDFETVRGVVREMTSASPRELVSEQTVDSSTVVFLTRFSANSGYSVYMAGEARVVVQSLTPGRTVVRVSYPAAGSLSPVDSNERYIFREIELRLKQVG
jgi:hypothetical protein